MSNVESEMSQPVSFDVFLEKLDEEIAKSNNYDSLQRMYQL